jgi:TPR repeat protein
MLYLRLALVFGALVSASGCEAATGVERSEQGTEPTSSTPVLIAPVAEPSPEPSELAPEAEPVAHGECATGESCHAAASVQDREKHPERAAPLYLRACELGVGQACHRLGELYLDGKGVAADDAKARELFELGCREGSMAACDALGH